MTERTNHEHESNRGSPKEDNKRRVENKCTALALDERLDTGGKDIDELLPDKAQYTFKSSFPSPSPARTTIYARDVDSTKKYRRYYRFFLLQHGRQHPAERLPDGYSEGWDGQRVRQEEVYNYTRTETILSQAEVKSPERKYALGRVMDESLQGFSRHYAGVDGAAIGFAALSRYDDVETAKDSHLVDAIEELHDVDGEALMEYVWRKYGGDD